jgi:hypothetical protein
VGGLFDIYTVVVVMGESWPWFEQKQRSASGSSPPCKCDVALRQSRCHGHAQMGAWHEHVQI